MPWADSERFTTKSQGLSDQIDALNGQGRRVSLIGASADASAVLNAHTRRPDKISGLAYVCSKINHPGRVGQKNAAG